VNLEELSPQQLQTLRPRLGEAGQARVDELLGVARPEPEKRRGRMNNTEAAYAVVLKHDPAVDRFEFEAIKLRLADGTWITVDFWVLYVDGREEMHEVKGFWRSRDRARIKIAARLYGWRWTFRAVRKRRQKDGGGWHTETFRGE
jgi:hypothetical protein